MKSFGRSDVGLKRANNEDSFLAQDTELHSLPNLFIVADGMGGHNAGEFASAESINFYTRYFETNTLHEDIKKSLEEAVLYANKLVYDDAKTDKSHDGMGTTFSAVTIINDTAYTAHVGDSRIYHLSNNELLQITEDHSFVSEMVKLGILTSEEAENHPDRNMITRALGISDSLEVDTYKFEVSDKDLILICSDGLNTMVSDSEIFDILSSDDSIRKKVDTLILQALQNGGLDNITVVLIEK